MTESLRYIKPKQAKVGFLLTPIPSLLPKVKVERNVKMTIYLYLASRPKMGAFFIIYVFV
jgi:hypothetical protein